MRRHHSRRFGQDAGAALAATPAEELVRLAALGPAYRTDRLLELGADLADVLVSYEAGRVAGATVRQAALAIAVEAGRVWLATVSRERACPVAGELLAVGLDDVDPLADSPWDTLPAL